MDLGSTTNTVGNLSATDAAISGSGKITPTTTALSVSTNLTYTIAAEIAGIGSLTKVGTGTAILSGANSYTHPVEVVLAVADVTVVPFGSAFYIDPVNGNDTYAGTSTNQPWKTLNRVNSTTFQPGDVINFKAGGTWLGTLRPLGSGTAANPILIDSYGTGAKPVIDGNGWWSRAQTTAERSISTTSRTGKFRIWRPATTPPPTACVAEFM